MSVQPAGTTPRLTSVSLAVQDVCPRLSGGGVVPSGAGYHTGEPGRRQAIRSSTEEQRVQQTDTTRG